MHRNSAVLEVIIVTILFTTLIFLSATHAFAHKVTIFAWVENGTIITESYFPDGKAVQNGTVSVFDSNEEPVLTGETNREGIFSFPMLEKDDLTIILDASAGHRATFKLSKEELEESTTETSQKREPREGAVSVGKIFVGIACIFGLMGIAMFIYNRKKK